MIFRPLLLVSALFMFTGIHAQEKWDIQRCVDFAMKNNISIRQSDLQARFSELDLKQNKAGHLPSLNFRNSMDYRLGRSENSSTGVFEDNNFLNWNMQLQSQVTLFNWFSLRNATEASRLTWIADKQQIEKAQNDVSLNVAVAYLQILLSREQARLAAVQISQTIELLSITRKKVDAGALPELNAVELESQLARDSSALATAEGTVQQFILQMKALLNLDAAAPFDVLEPPLATIPVLSLAELQPESVYALAIANLPQQKVNDTRLQAAQKTVAAYKGKMFPTISGFGSLGTNYVSIKNFGVVPAGFKSTGAFVTVNGTDILVYAPAFDFVEGKPTPIGKQFSNNFGQSIGIGISVPIFNGRQARTAWDRSKLQVKQLELTKELDNQTLKQDIHKAYNDASVALQKFNANKRAVEFSQKAYEYAQKRYDVALLSTYDLVTTQNNLQRARIDLLYSQYDYVFKIKLLEFYRGQGIKL